MKLPTLSRKMFIVICTIVVILILGTFWCNRAHAAEPAPKWDLFIPVTMSYVDDLGVAGGFGGISKSSGLLLMGQISYTRIDGQSGSVAYTPSYDSFAWPQPQPVMVPYTTPSRDFVGVSFTIGIPLRKAH